MNLTCIVVHHEGKVLCAPLGQPVLAVSLGLVVHHHGKLLGPGVGERGVEVLESVQQSNF